MFCLTEKIIQNGMLSCKNALQAKHKLYFIDGNVPKPQANPQLARWLANNSMIIGWIRTSIEPCVRSTVTFIAEPHKLWKNLLQRFSVNNGVRESLLEEEIALCRHTGQSVIEYFGRLTNMWMIFIIIELDTIVYVVRLRE